MSTQGTTYSGYRDERLQERLRRLIDRAGHQGMTVLELRKHFDADHDAHHGWISGALSELHKAHRIARLTEKRQGCKVYVELDFIDSRPVERQGNPEHLSKEEISRLVEIRDFLDYWFQVDTEGARFTTDKTKAERNQRMFFSNAKRLFGDWVEGRR